MFKISQYKLIFLLVFPLIILLACSDSDNTVNDGDNPIDPVASDSLIANHLAAVDFDLIPSQYIEDAAENLKIYYGHTSHGSQLMSGLNIIETIDAGYVQPTFYEYGDDLGGTGDISWVQPTRDWLDANSDYNVVIWSWCGGCSGNTEEGINIYLNAMNQLEANYPGVTFVYMTGHLDGTGVDGNLYARNNQIRAYCQANDKVLFDFADIESYDPDLVYYPDETDACAWCSEWCAENDCPDCVSCAHSHCFNCYQKGRAFWWLLARMAGWSGDAP